MIRFDQLGTILRLRELLVTIAKQLDVQDPETRTDTDLEKQIVQHLSEKSALIIIDNLETMESMVDVLAFLDRICDTADAQGIDNDFGNSQKTIRHISAWFLW